MADIGKEQGDAREEDREKEGWEETAQILGEEETVKQIKRSCHAWSKGKKKEFVSLDELKAKLGV